MPRSVINESNSPWLMDWVCPFTSDVPAAALRAWIKDFISIDATRLTLLFESFGFKHGVPLDADLVFDVRCLPNPYYEPELQPLTGCDPAVVDFLVGLAVVVALMLVLGVLPTVAIIVPATPASAAEMPNVIA